MRAGSRPAAPLIPRTIRFPKHVRERIAADAERCGRSFEQQVIAVLRSHYGEDVDIAPAPDAVLALVRGSLKGTSVADRKVLLSRLREDKAR